MSPTNPHIAIQLRQLIYYHLDNDFLQNALFLAGRLYSLDPRSADASHLLALCNLRLGRLKAAYDYSRDKGYRGQHLGCAYVFAQACLALERYADGIAALDRARGLWSGRNHWNKHSETSRRHLPDAAAVNCLLGKLSKAHGDPNKAVDCYVEALKQNPFMWDAFIDLCETGAAVRPQNIFKLTSELQAFLGPSSMIVNGSTFESDSTPQTTQLSKPYQALSTPSNDPFNPTSRTSHETGLNHGGSNLLSKLNGGRIPQGDDRNGGFDGMETPPGVNYDDDTLMGEASAHHTGDVEPPQAPIRKTRTLHAFNTDSGMDAPRMRGITTRSKVKSTVENNEPSDIPKPVAHPNHKRTVSGHASQANNSVNPDPTMAPPRRSTRLNQLSSTISQLQRPFASKIAAASKDSDANEKRELKRPKATGTRGRSAATSTVGRVVSGNRKPMELTSDDLKDSRPKISVGAAISQPLQPKSIISTDMVREQEALQWLLDLLGKLGNGYFQLSRYRCQAALQAFMSVSPQQRETPWVLSQIGKIYYEKRSYVEAQEVFARIRKICPSHMESMEIYSTVLWHLKKETDLAYLAHELIEADRLSPEAWCAIGNAFSLQRDHDQAIKCFKRATQLDPRFTYAFTLQGHEHVANEEFDKASLAYRLAISADRRHYHGWYGLGKVYEKMGKYEIAEKHYKNAHQFNPTNVVLIVQMGVVLEKMRNVRAALLHYTHACDLDPRSPLPRYEKARALMKLQMPREALVDLEILKDLEPDDAKVHFALGRLYKMMKQKTLAIKHFTIALNLDPRASMLIKDAMENLDDDDDELYDDDDE